MATNDAVLLEGILNDRISRRLPSEDESEVFEYFAFEQLLKDADLSDDDLRTGMVDGRDDGGIDGAFLLVNGILLTDAANFVWPKSNSELVLWIITCKRHETYKLDALDKLTATLSEVLQLRLPDADLKGAYSAEILRVRGLLNLAYRTLAPRLSVLKIRVAYVSAGDSSAVGEAVRSRSNQITTLVSGLFGSCKPEFLFVGASDLIRMHRQARTLDLDLPFLECLAKGERYVLLTSLTDYARFVLDEQGTPRRYLYESNVRDYMGLNQVNDDIRATLRGPGPADFWWLNNGVTILATAAAVTGKSIKIQNVQIVNGLQTTESIARFYAEGGTDSHDRSVLVKVIVTSDPAIRDSIIRATNNQTNVETASLRATDPRQRDIEEILERHGLFYERRKNQHLNLGRSAEAIVAPLYAASAIVTLVLKSPFVATSLKQRFMRQELSYEAVFGGNIPLDAWPSAVGAMRLADAWLKKGEDEHRRRGERFLRNWRQITSLLAVSRVVGSFSFNAARLAELKLVDLTDAVMSEVWEVVDKHRSPTSINPPTKAVVREIVNAAAAEFGIRDAGAIEARHPFRNAASRISDDFLDRVDAELPHQPWRPGVHRLVAERLGCRPAAVSEAIEMLMVVGRRNLQKDGVVFDASGAVIAEDLER